MPKDWAHIRYATLSDFPPPQDKKTEGSCEQQTSSDVTLQACIDGGAKWAGNCDVSKSRSHLFFKPGK